MKTDWNLENIPDQSSRVIVVTGSSSGLGFETARAIAKKNGTVVIAVRNLSKGEKAAEKIKAEYPNAKLDLLQLDLADLSSVKSFSEQFKNKYSQLNLLINNAGVMMPPYTKSKDGFELQMGTNHLGHFALTAQLFEILKSTQGSRIVNVASLAHRYGNINFDDLTWEKRKYKKMRAYGDSKLANLYFTYYLADKLNTSNSDVTVTASHPGWTATELQRHVGVFEFLNSFFAMPQEQGALTTLRAAFETEAKNGDFFGPDGFNGWKGYPIKVESNALSKDKSIAAKLWEISEKLTNTKFKI